MRSRQGVKVMTKPRQRRPKPVPVPPPDPSAVQFQMGMTQTGHVRIAMMGPSEDNQGWGMFTLDLTPAEALDISESFDKLIEISTKMREREGLWIHSEGRG